MKVKDLIKKFEKLPQDAEVLVRIKELGGFQQIGFIKTEDGKGFEGKFGKIVVILDEKPFEWEKKVQHQEEQENLCPECSFFCEERFKDGICK